MGGIEADLQALGILHAGEDRRDFLKASAETGTLTRRGFEGDADLQLGMLRMEAVEIADHARGAGLDARPQMGSRMENQ